MNKLTALLPLLGWFYISLGLFAIVQIFAPKALGRATRILFFLGFGVLALTQMVKDVRHELTLFPQEKRSVLIPWESKISNESGNYFALYYQAFRPKLQGVPFVRLYEVSTREFHYARMYLYPTGVGLVGVNEKQAGYAIVGKGELQLFKNVQILVEKDGKYLITHDGGLTK